MANFKLIKNEKNNRYGDIDVIEYTDEREPSNGCVKWLCQCMHCGHKFLRNGNHLRFSKTVRCPKCKIRSSKRR